MFPISRDPPEGGTLLRSVPKALPTTSFQFLGIPPKGEHCTRTAEVHLVLPGFQFLGIPPKGEREYWDEYLVYN